jgi:hypothetical protein
MRDKTKKNRRIIQESTVKSELKGVLDLSFKTDAPDSRVTLSFKRGQYIFYEGHFPYGVLVPNSGNIKVFYQDQRRRKYQGYLPLKTPFGFDLLMMNSPYPLTGVAESEVVVVSFIPRFLVMGFDWRKK